ncbi:sphingosine N-acyltransferase lac1 [Podospora australis]|uniref:Sphingosine N-acyltransferase lac1 n=1 Tax=Podospora australis TaxID=1536484 RepID=A0AAN7AID5_9PEZI|nr:sphingosine N-acyltransferase lac1 [Podospora australis]
MSKRNTMTETANPAPLQSVMRASPHGKPTVNGDHQAQKGTGTFFLALMVSLLCIQLDYFFDAATGKTLLSYKQEHGYGTGPWDAAFVAFYAVVILLVKILITKQHPQALATFFGAKSPQRFAEQLFSFVYFSCSTVFGLVIMQGRHPWSMDAQDLVAEVEAGTFEGKVKCFYLLQAGFWVQEALFIAFQLEKPRQDYVQLIFHHVITLVAIGLSYVGKYTDLGVMILVTHDASDAILSVAKLLRYVRSSFTGPAWLIFLFTWLYTRHYLMIPVIYLTWQFSSELDERGYSSLRKSSLFSMGLLVLIQTLNLYWLTFILRGFYKLLFSSGTTKDMRSDEEDEGDSEEE